MKKIFNILILFFFLNHCEYKPIYSDLENKADFKLNIINIDGDSEMNSLVSEGVKKYSKKSETCCKKNECKFREFSSNASNT